MGHLQIRSCRNVFRMMSTTNDLLTLTSGNIINVSKITRHIYLGGIIYDIKDFKRFIQEYDIGAIVSVWDDDKLAVHELGLVFHNYLYVYISDNQTANIMQYFDLTYKFLIQKIDVENKNVFVHCHAGLSRSASIVMYYLMRRCRLSQKEAYNLIMQKRHIKPNNSFMRQLEIAESNIQF